MAAQSSPRKGPGGRPKKAEHERRVDSLHADVTYAEKQYARDQAKLAGMTLSEYIRRRCLDHEVAPRKSLADARFIHELNAIGVNLNQIARNLNANRLGAQAVSMEDLQHRFNEVLDRAMEILDD